jgi:3',5'-cyclic AMP phosphodiesterase CpdA
MGFRLAHLSDPHIGPLPPLTPPALWGKRGLGYLAWRVRKQRIHRPEVLAALRADLQAQAPDHVAITGDLVNLALPGEFVQAAAWLQALGPPEWISVVPGNHDATVRIAQARSLAHWAPYMSSDAPERDGGFPYVRRRGPLAIVGLTTAIPTPPGFATGRLGDGQLRALDQLLETLAAERCWRVVLLHHPPLDGVSSWRKRLIDAPALRRVLAGHDVDLVLHGHEHVATEGTLPGRTRAIRVAGMPSCSSIHAHPQKQAQYQIHEIESDGDGGWRCAVRTRRYDPAAARFRAA